MTNTRRFASPFAERFDLRVPVVQAPMAGGPTSPAMAAGVLNAGALGFLAAAPFAADKLASEVAEIRTLTGRPFGVNLFVLEPYAPDDATVRRALQVIDPLRTGFGLPAGKPLGRKRREGLSAAELVEQLHAEWRAAAAEIAHLAD